MKIQVRYLAQLRLAVGRGADSVECADGCTVGQLLQSLAALGDAHRAALLDADGGARPSLLIFLGDEQSGRDLPLSDGDEVTLMTPIAGGA